MTRWFKKLLPGTGRGLAEPTPAVFPRSFPEAFRDCISAREAARLDEIGLVAKERRSVPVTSLMLQFRSEWPFLAPADYPRARRPLPLGESPMADALQHYAREGRSLLAPERLHELSFFRMWKSVNEVGWSHDWYHYPARRARCYTDADIQAKLERLIAVYENIRAHGYRGGDFGNRMITVLNEPFENTRFGFEHRMDGYEIWSGHHRAAALSVLGHSPVEVLLLCDGRAGRNVSARP